jgi:hypothetical protein
VEVIRNAVRSLHILVRLYFMRHSLEATDSYLVSPLSRVAILSMESADGELPPHALDERRATLALALKGLASQGENVNVARALFGLVRNAIPQEELDTILQREQEHLSVDNVKADGDCAEGQAQTTWMPTIVHTSGDARSQALLKLVMRPLNDLATAKAGATTPER